MTRKEIEEGYETDGDCIASPGRFEGEALYVVYFWDAYLNGCVDDDDGEVLTFNVAPEDIAEFPELAGRATVRLMETDAGFVCELD
jgi:hypothetical protein